MGHQEPMEPEAVPAGLVATHHLRVVREPKALLGPVNLDKHRFDRSRRHLPFPRSLRRACGEPKTPCDNPQLKRQKQGRCAAGILTMLSPCLCGHWLAPSLLIRVLKELTTSGRFVLVSLHRIS